ncbi:hypothetical protein QL285_021543 [Trifolium repens]|nr:hypothetical protein QL285_021543 [Trifolium repens]
MARTKNTSRRPPLPTLDIEPISTIFPDQNSPEITTTQSEPLRITNVIPEPINDPDINETEAIVIEAMFEISKSIPNSESESFVTPQEPVIPQTQTTTPPIQTYKKKSKAKISQTPKPRRSGRLESGSFSSRKPAIDNTIYEIMDSDSDEEATPSPPRQTKSISKIVEQAKPTETSKSEPTKPKTSKGDFFANIERFVEKGQRKEKENAEKIVEEEEEVAEAEGKRNEERST